MIKIYKNTIDEDVRIKCLELINSAPDPVWTQSVCTDESVIQLRDAMPWYVMKELNRMHLRMKSTVEKDFDILGTTGSFLTDPDYSDISKSSIITVDKRLPGMSLSPHADVPTGTFTKHIGSENGVSYITLSLIYYWDDNFTGGEIDFHENAVFSNDDNLQMDLAITKSYKPVRGDLLVFRSNIVHSIRTVESGERISSQYFYSIKPTE